jgi:hypothetical protein
MKKIIIILITVILSAVSISAQINCQTYRFERARKELAREFGRRQRAVGFLEQKAVTTHEVGDTMTFWNWDLSVMPPEWIQVPATCRAVTDYAYVFVADDQWNENMDSSDVEQVAYYWEEGTYNDSTAGIYSLCTGNFGMPPDELDNDDHIYIFYSELGSFQGSVFDGYFSVFNEYTEEEAQQLGGHSNEVEMFYMSCYPGDPVSPIRISVLAHEFEHMIHWAADPDEESWVDEGCAEYAMLLFGMPDPLVNFPSNSDNDLTQWNNQFADYVKTFMFFTYLADHFGGSDMIRAVVQEPLNSISGVGMALANNGYQIPVQAVFVSWTIANYYHGWSSGLDDLDSLYLYFSIDPPPFGRSEYVSSFPSGPNSRDVNNWAADYIVFAEQDWESYPLSIQFEGSQTGDFCLALLYYCNGNSYCTIADCPPDNIWDYQANFEYDDVAFMVCAPSDGSHNYTWSADLITGVNEKIEMPDKLSLESVSPNPFNNSTQIRFAIPSGGYAKLEIYDIGGRLVRRWLLDEARDQGEIIWDGTDSEGREVATGMYLFKLSDDDNVQVVKGTLLK